MQLAEELYVKFHKELYGFCCGMALDAELSKDIVQESFLKAIEYEDFLETLSEEAQRAWLYRTVKNRFIDEMRRKKFRTELTDGEDLSAEEKLENLLAKSRSTETEREAFEWQELLSHLPGQEGLFFTLRYLYGYTSGEIGSRFRMPPGTVRSLLYAARKHLRELIEEVQNGK